MQQFITYSTTQSMVGLSDRLTFQNQGGGYTSNTAGQKAYQAMVRQCFNCHNNHTAEGINASGFGLPQQKSFRSSTDMKSRFMRFVVDSHVAQKSDTAYSKYLSQSNLNASMSNTLNSARDRINFDAPNESQLLVYARCDNLHANVSHPFCLADTDPDYLAIKNWVEDGIAVNLPPTVDTNIPAITFAEYDEPAFQGPITWSDPDPNELSQLVINESSSSAHTFNDTMLALEYDSFTSARVRTYAILGDRGQRQFEFVVTDGQANSQIQRVPVNVNSTYVVPKPESTLPEFTAFYTVRDTGELRRIDHDGNDTSVGFIDGYSPNFSTVYRRADKG